MLDANGNLAVSLLVGISLSSLVRQIRGATPAQVNLYDLQGQPVASTLHSGAGSLPLPSDVAAQVTARQTHDSLIRDFAVAGASYSEIVGPWQARNGEQLGLIGWALTRNYFAVPTTLTRLQALVLVAAAFVVIIVLGTLLASHITRPLIQMVRASNQAARSNLVDDRHLGR